jgi:hypothetical protein
VLPHDPVLYAAIILGSNHIQVLIDVRRNHLLLLQHAVMRVLHSGEILVDEHSFSRGAYPNQPALLLQIR